MTALATNVTTPDAHYKCALRRACSQGWLASVQWLLADERVDPGDNDNGALRWAVECGHVQVTRCLLADSRCCPDADTLAGACSEGHDNVVRLLLADSRVDVGDACAPSRAAKGGFVDVVRLLMTDARVDVHENGDEAVRVARRFRRIAVCRCLLFHCTAWLMGVS